MKLSLRLIFIIAGLLVTLYLHGQFIPCLDDDLDFRFHSNTTFCNPATFENIFWVNGYVPSGYFSNACGRSSKGAMELRLIHDLSTFSGDPGTYEFCVTVSVVHDIWSDDLTDLTITPLPGNFFDYCYTINVTQDMIDDGTYCNSVWVKYQRWFVNPSAPTNHIDYRFRKIDAPDFCLEATIGTLVIPGFGPTTLFSNPIQSYTEWSDMSTALPPIYVPADFTINIDIDEGLFGYDFVMGSNYLSLIYQTLVFIDYYSFLSSLICCPTAFICLYLLPSCCPSNRFVAQMTYKIIMAK